MTIDYDKCPEDYDLQEALDRSAPKPKPKPRRHAEYAHPFSCEGTGQWED